MPKLICTQRKTFLPTQPISRSAIPQPLVVLAVCLSVSLFLCLTVSLLCLSVSLSLCLSVSLSLSISLSFSISLYLSFSVILCLCLSVSLYLRRTKLRAMHNNSIKFSIRNESKKHLLSSVYFGSVLLAEDI